MADVTFDMLRDWEPCSDYRKDNYGLVRKIAGDRKSMSHHEIAALDIPLWDRYWVLIRLLTPRNQRLLACEIAESALVAEREAGREPHPDSWCAIDVARRYANGLATEDELAAARAAVEAARAAARAAVEAAARAAAYTARYAALRAAACTARYAALRAAAYTARYAALRAAAWDAEWDKYLAMAVRYIDEQEGNCETT